MRRAALLAACGLAVLALGRLSAQQSPVFRAAVDIVDVDVSVLDRNRLPVTGLTADDFTVFEDGKPRPIVAFSAVDLPPRTRPSAPWMAEIAPDLLTNAFPREGRLVTILVDRSIAFADQRAAREFAEAAVDQLRPGDLAAVAYSTFGVPQNFTADRVRLKQVIRQPLLGLPEGQDNSEAACICGVCTLETVARVAEAMQDVRHRRKVLLLLASRISVQPQGACAGALGGVLGRATRALEAGNVTVHVFDPSGVQTIDAFSASASGRPAVRPGSELRRRGNLRVLPDETGGRLIADPFRPADTVAAVFRESDSYYILGFQPGSTAPSDRFRRIRVSVNRRDVTLQARQGYFANGATRRDAADLPAGTSAALRAAISGLWPDTAMPVAMSLVPLASPLLDGGIVAVTLAVTARDADGPPVSAPADSELTRARVLVGAFDRNGKALAFDEQTLAMRPGSVTNRERRYQFTLNLPLKTGRYEVRAAVQDEALGTVGSVYGYVDIPDFRKQAVTLSGLLVHAPADRVPAPPPAVASFLPVVPTARRTFARSDQVSAALRLYWGLGRRATPGYMTAEVRDEQDRVVYRQETRITPDTMGAGRATELSFDLPLARLDPGAYLFAVETRHGSETARRDLRFQVVE
jgi:VWFA-related protein